MMATLSTHVLDTALGRPAAGIHVELARDDDVIGAGITDGDGRVREFGGASLSEGTYRLTFHVAQYFAATGRDAFYADIVVAFRVATGVPHYHVPLLLSPFGYSTYRGS